MGGWFGSPGCPGFQCPTCREMCTSWFLHTPQAPLPPTQDFSETAEKGVCCICRDSLSKGHLVALNPCKQMVHLSCLDEMTVDGVDLVCRHCGASIDGCGDVYF